MKPRCLNNRFTKSAILLAFILSIISCVGATPFSTATSGSQSSENNALSNAPTGFRFTDNEGNVITQASNQDIIKIQSEDNGLTLMSIKIEGPVDLTKLTAFIDSAIFLAHFDDETSKQNITSLTAYVPCSSEAVVVCPGVTETDEVSQDCADGIELTADDPSDSGYTLDGRFEGLCHVSADIETFGTGILGSTSQTEDLNGPFKTCSFMLPFPPPACGPTICGVGTFIPDPTVGLSTIITTGLESCGNGQITCRVPCSESALCGQYLGRDAFEGSTPDMTQCQAASASSISKPNFECPDPNILLLSDFKDPNNYNEPNAEYWCMIRTSDFDYDPPEINFFVAPDIHGPFPLATTDPLDSIDQPGIDAGWTYEAACPYPHNHDVTVEGHFDNILSSCGHGGFILLDAIGNVL